MFCYELLYKFHDDDDDDGVGDGDDYNDVIILYVLN